MAGMYPDNQELTIFGEKVQWPGVDSSGKFSNGSFKNPLEKPSFIPAETINLVLDNLSELIKKLGGTPNNTSVDQLAKLFTIAATANTGIMRDASGRAKVAAPKADDDVARKAEVDRGKEDTLKSARSYTDQKVQAEAQTRAQGDTSTLNAAKNYADQRVQEEAQTRAQGDAAIQKKLEAHIKDNNPHGISKEKIGLGNVNNTSDAQKSVKYAATAGSAKANGGNADTVGGFKAGNGTGMLVPVTAFSISGGTGYIKFGNGLLLQWGTTGKKEQNTTVYFPIAFRSNNYAIAGMPVARNGIVVTTFSMTRKSNSSFSVKRWVGASFYDEPEDVYYIAVGV